MNGLSSRLYRRQQHAARRLPSSPQASHRRVEQYLARSPNQPTCDQMYHAARVKTTQPVLRTQCLACKGWSSTCPSLSNRAARPSLSATGGDAVHRLRFGRRKHERSGEQRASVLRARVDKCGGSRSMARSVWAVGRLSGKIFFTETNSNEYGYQWVTQYILDRVVLSDGSHVC